MGLLHLSNSIREAVRIHARGKFYIAPVPVVAQPVVGALRAEGYHRHQDIIVLRTVLGEVLEDTFDGKLQPLRISVINLSADDISSQLLGKAPTHHHAAPFSKRLHRIACYDRPVKHFEEASICAGNGSFELVAFLIQKEVSVEDEGGTGSYLYAGNFFHKAHGHASAHLTVLVFIPVLGIPGVYSVHPVDVLVEAVVTQFKEHLGNEHDAHGQPYAQG